MTFGGPGIKTAKKTDCAIALFYIMDVRIPPRLRILCIAVFNAFIDFGRTNHELYFYFIFFLHESFRIIRCILIENVRIFLEKYLSMYTKSHDNIKE